MTYDGQAKVAGFLAIGLLVITAGATIAMFCVEIPAGNQTLAGQTVGTLLTLLGACVMFFYSTSSGNRKDSDTIATLAQTAQAAQSALTPNAKPDVLVPAGESVTVKADDPEA